jgi:hypothetical protein
MQLPKDQATWTPEHWAVFDATLDALEALLTCAANENKAVEATLAMHMVCRDVRCHRDVVKRAARELGVDPTRFEWSLAPRRGA